MIRGNRRHVLELVLAETLRPTHRDLAFEEVDRFITDPLLLAHTARIDARAHHAPADHLAVLVVDGNGPADDVKAAEQLLLRAVFRCVRMQAQVRQRLVLHAHEQTILVDAARAGARETAPLLDRNELHVGRDFHRSGADFVERGALIVAADDVPARVQCRRVIVVGGVVLHLQPVAMLEVAERHELVARQHGEVAFPFRKRRLLFGRSHVREHETVALDGLVRTLPDRARVFLRFGLFAFRKRYMQTRAVDVENHAVIAALDAVLLDRAVFERCATMHAMRMQHADAAAAVAKRDEFFVEDLQEARRIGQFHRHAHRMPEAAHVFAKRRARTGFGQLGVVIGNPVRVVAAIRDQLVHHRAATRATAFFLLVRFDRHGESPLFRVV